VHIDWLNVWQQFEPADYPDYIGGRFFSVEGCAHLQSSTAVDPFSGERIEGWLLAGAEEIEYQTARFAQHPILVLAALVAREPSRVKLAAALATLVQSMTAAFATSLPI